MQHVVEAQWPSESWEAATALMLEVQNGCTVAFGKLYDVTSTRLLRYIRRINRDVNQAEELLQEVYERAWSRRAQYDPGRGSGTQWLVTIAHHLAVSSLRRKSVRPVFVHVRQEDDSDDYAGMVSLWEGPEQLLIRAQMQEAVWEAMATLGSEQRNVLALAFSDDLSHRDLAEHFGRPLGTIKSWVRRSLLSLQGELAEFANEGAGR